MSLLEKLQGIKSKTPEPVSEPESEPESEQCECGAGLKGECECGSDADEDLLKKLEHLGEKRGINPPAPDEPIDLVPTEKAQETLADEPSKTPCPICKKEFIHLSRHKCKGEAPPAPSPQKTISLKGTATLTEGYKKTLQGKEIPKKPIFYTLCIDCIPYSDEDDVVFASILIEPVVSQIKTAFAVAHWTHLEYGRGPGELEARLDKWLSLPLPVQLDGSYIVLDSKSIEARAITSVLKKYATVVIQGIK